MILLIFYNRPCIMYIVYIIIVHASVRGLINCYVTVIFIRKACTRIRMRTTFNIFTLKRVFSISLGHESQVCLGFPLSWLRCILAPHTLFIILVSSILRTCPNHPSCLSLINCSTGLIFKFLRIWKTFFCPLRFFVI